MNTSGRFTNLNGRSGQIRPIFKILVYTDQRQFFPVQIFDAKTAFHVSSDCAIKIILSTLQESGRISYVPGIEEI